MKHIITYLLAVTIMLIFISCSDNTVNNPGTPSSSYPNINLKVNSVYKFTNDSVFVSGPNQRTSIVTTDSIMAKGSFFGQTDAFMIRVVSVDTAAQPPTIKNIDTVIVKYDLAEGKFFQYGVVRLIDSTQNPQWDTVADFTKPIGTVWNIATINNVMGYSGTKADIQAKVLKDTSFNATGSGNQLINAYKIEIKAIVTFSIITITTIYLDYYLGYTPSGSSNPSGIVRINLKPFTFYNLSFPGFDQILQTWRIP